MDSSLYVMGGISLVAALDVFANMDSVTLWGSILAIILFGILLDLGEIKEEVSS